MSKNGQLDKHHVIEALKKIRCEWEEAADGEPLEDIKGHVGCLLLDVVQGIGLSEDEQLAVLGRIIPV